MRGLFLALVALLVAGCGAKPAAPVKEYTMIGEVIRLDPDTKTATIKHEAIQGWMGAMTMEYPVKERPEFAKLHSGDHIRATVYVQGDEYWIGGIRTER